MTTVTPLVVACDESGNDGENLLLGNARVFTHASVAMPLENAEAIMAEVRERTKSTSVELKSQTLLRPGHREVARWLLTHAEVRESSSVLATHKRYFLSTKLFDSTVEEAAHARDIDLYESGLALSGAMMLHFMAPRFYGEAWDELLRAFQDFLRAKTDSEAAETLIIFGRRLESLAEADDSPLSEILSLMLEGVEHLESLSRFQLGKGIPTRLRTGDPLISAIGSAVMYWFRRANQPVKILHDETSILTPEQVALLRQGMKDFEFIAPSMRGRRFGFDGLETCDSKDDARVQVADLLAGIGRAVFEDADRGRHHPLQQALLPLMSGETMWPIAELMDPNEARKSVEDSRFGEGSTF